MSSKTVIVKLHRDGNEFEILVNSDLAYEYITGKRSDPLAVLESEDIFKDARKGERQSDERIKKAFGTNDIAKVVEAMLKNGEVPITTEQRNKLDRGEKEDGNRDNSKKFDRPAHKCAQSRPFASRMR